MTVKIEMDMPTTCATCKLSQFIHKGDNSKWYCTIKEKHSRLFPTKRPTWCPLQECEHYTKPTEKQAREIMAKMPGEYADFCVWGLSNEITRFIILEWERIRRTK